MRPFIKASCAQPSRPDGKEGRRSPSQGPGRRIDREISLLSFKGRLLDVGMDPEGNIVLIIKRRHGAESVLGAARVMVGGEFVFKAILDMGERASEERLGAAAPSGGE
ncbi:MAG: hypothetical protein QXG08_06135 [Candidatus Methanomethyliaceae archaeon]